MRHNLKAAAVSVLAIMAALAMSIPAYAADKKISEVKFRVNAKPEAGDSIGDPDVQVTKGNVEITEQEFDNDDSEWVRGDKPVIYLTKGRLSVIRHKAFCNQVGLQSYEAIWR